MPSGNHHRNPVVRSEGYPATNGSRMHSRQAGQIHVRENRPQDDLQLLHRERRTQTGAVAAAEGKPFVVAVFALQKSLRAESFRLRIQVRPLMHKVIAWAQKNARGIGSASREEWRFR